MKIKYFIITALLTFFCVPLIRAEAATISVFGEKKIFGAGEEFTLDIKVDTEDLGINAAQATVNFPISILELVSVDKQGSVFNFWVEEPLIANENGTLKFIGGTAKGVSGSSLQILKLKLKARGAGEATINIGEAVVTASDGRGTNVLSEIKGINIVVVARGAVLLVPQPTPVAQEAPQRVVRTAISGASLPQAPELRVPAYPDPARWYNHLADAIVLWEVPSDITQVATAITQNPNTDPQKVELELFNGKNFGVLKEGIWYAHVQFRNNVGWGKIVHYRIAIDTTAPLPFEAFIDEQVTQNPSPTLNFESQDSLSGISRAAIVIDGRAPIETVEKGLKIPPQLLGKHNALVKIFDFAGNSIEDDLEFEILPLPQPTLNFLTQSVSQDDFVYVSGKAVPNGFVDLTVIGEGGQEVFRGSPGSDNLGNWEIIIEQTFPLGNYMLSGRARDDRGAISFPADLGVFKIKAKSILSLGFIELGWFEIAIIIVLIVVSLVSISSWYYIARENKRRAYGIVAGRDVDKLANLLSNDLKAIEEWVKRVKTIETKDKTEARFLFKKMKETILKMKKYLGEEVEKLK